MKKYARILSILLALTLLVSLAPTTKVFAKNEALKEEVSASEDIIALPEHETLQLDADCQILNHVNPEVFAAGNHVARLPEQETLSSYVFLNADGTQTIYFMEQPVKFEKADGAVVEKNLALKATTEGYTTLQNNVQLTISTSPTNGIRLDYDNYQITLIPQGGNPTSLAQTTEGAVIYPNYYGEGMSLRYTPTLSGVKEDIVLESYKGVNSFVFQLYTDGLRLYQENGRYYLAETETSEMRVDLGDVVVFDANTRFSLGTLTTETIVDGEQYQLVLSVDESFLTDEDTKYPVYIDPILVVLDNTEDAAKAIEDVSIYSGKPNTNANWTFLYSGYYDDTFKVGRSLFRLNGLLDSNIYKDPDTYTITKAEFHIREATGTASNVVLLNANAGNSAWSESGATWNNAGAVLGTQYAAASPSYNSDTVYDITNLVAAWQNDICSADAGFILRSSDEITSAKGFHSSEYPTTSYRPYVAITYTGSGYGGGSTVASATSVTIDGVYATKTAIAYEKRYYKFTPEIPGEYLIYSDNRVGGDPYIWLYDSNMVLIAYNDNTGGNLNFKLSYTFAMGETYYISVGQAGSLIGQFNVNLLPEAIIPTDVYHLRNAETMHYVDMYGSDPQGLVYLGTSHTGSSMKWTIGKRPNGYYIIQSESDDKCYLGVSNTDAGNDNICLYAAECDEVYWKIYAKSSGELLLSPKTAASMALYVPWGSDGENLQLTYFSNSSNNRHKWKIEFWAETDLEGQRWNNWCWAAAVRMLVGHYTKVLHSQDEAVTAVKGSVCDCTGTYEDAIAAANYYATSDTSNNALNLRGSWLGVYDELSLCEVLNNGHVIFITRGWYDDNNIRDGGHAYVITGYTTIYSYGMLSIRYIIFDPMPEFEPDPWTSPTNTDGQCYAVSYRWLRNGSWQLEGDPDPDNGIWEGFILPESALVGDTIMPEWNVSY